MCYRLLSCRVWAAKRSYKEDGWILEHDLWGFCLFWDCRQAFLLWFEVFERSFHMHRTFDDHFVWCVTADHDGICCNLEVFIETVSGGKIFDFAASFSHIQWLCWVVAISLKLNQLPRAWLWLFSILIFFVSGFLCALSTSYTISSQELSLKAVLEVLSFRGAIFLLLCTYNVSKYEDNDGENEECLYAPLSDQLNEVDPISHVTPFAKSWIL